MDIQGFFEAIKAKMTAVDYERLHEILGISKYRLTTLIKGTVPFRKKELLTIGEFINIDITEYIMTYGVGKDVFTLQDMNQLLHPQGMELGIVSHAA